MDWVVNNLYPWIVFQFILGVPTIIFSFLEWGAVATLWFIGAIFALFTIETIELFPYPYVDFWIGFFIQAFIWNSLTQYLPTGPRYKRGW